MNIFLPSKIIKHMPQTKENVVLEVTNLHKNYGKIEVLKGVSLKAHQGEVISMIGASGSGKSTFLRCINFLELPSAGNISIMGSPVSVSHGSDGYLHPSDKRELARLRSRLSMVFQSFNLWQHMTVLQNVIEAPVTVLGLPRSEAIEQAEYFLNKVGILDKKEAFPAHLSGGQQQRVAIARALCMNPIAMLFDEPTSALDPELVGEVLKVIRDLAKEGRTMLLVTHEMKLARDISDHVVFLHKGLIEEQGSPTQIFENPSSERCKQFTSKIF